MMQARGGAVTGVESGDLDGIVGLGHDVVALDAFAGQSGASHCRNRTGLIYWSHFGPERAGLPDET